MLYTSKQAAELLNVKSNNIITSAVRRGIMKPVNSTDSGHRVEHRFTMDEINRVKNLLNTKGKFPRFTTVKEIPIQSKPEETPKMFPNSNLMNRLDRIEAKLDAILNLWK